MITGDLDSCLKDFEEAVKLRPKDSVLLAQIEFSKYKRAMATLMAAAEGSLFAYFLSNFLFYSASALLP